MSHLFAPLALGPLQLSNRIVVAPMCQYSSVDGEANDWHVQHWGTLSQSGAGLLTGKDGRDGIEGAVLGAVAGRHAGDASGTGGACA